MKQLSFVLLYFFAATFSYAQLDAVKPGNTKTPQKVKPVRPSRPSTPAKTGSYIIVFRGGQLAAALSNYSIYIDGKRVCKLSNGRYFKYPVSPGKHEIEAKKAGVDISKREIYISVVSQSGMINYVVCNVKTSLLKEKVTMNEVPESSGRQTVNSLKEDNCQSDIGYK